MPRRDLRFTSAGVTSNLCGQQVDIIELQITMIKQSDYVHRENVRWRGFVWGGNGAVQKHTQSQ